MKFNPASVFGKVTSLIISLLFIVIGLLFFFKFDPAAYDVKATGTIVEIAEYYDTTGTENELHHSVYIDFFAGDKKFEHVDYGKYNYRMKVGDEVELYYMSADPTQIAGTDKEKVPYIGLAFAVIGFIFLAITVIRTLRGKRG